MAEKQRDTLLYIGDDHGVEETNKIYKEVKIKQTIIYVCIVVTISLILAIGITVSLAMWNRANQNFSLDDDNKWFLDDPVSSKHIADNLPEYRLIRFQVPEDSWQYDSYENMTTFSTERVVDGRNIVEVVQMDIGSHLKIITTANQEGRISTTIVEDTMKRLMVFKDHQAKTCLAVELSAQTSSLLSEAAKLNDTQMETNEVLQAQLELDPKHVQNQYGNAIANTCSDSRTFRANLMGRRQARRTTDRRQRRRAWMNEEFGVKRPNPIRVLCCRCVTSPCPCDLVPCTRPH